MARIALIHAMTAHFDAMVAHMGIDATLISVCAKGAFDALSDGDTVRHDSWIAEAVERLSNYAVILLTQFSMASAAKIFENRVSCPKLTRPDSAIQHLKG